MPATFPKWEWKCFYIKKSMLCHRFNVFPYYYFFLQSLSGHSTPVDCVRFSITEEQVCAGSQAGALKIWDLETAKILRTLTGHRASIRCVDFHPYGDFLASGSSDSGIKV